MIVNLAKPYPVILVNDLTDGKQKPSVIVSQGHAGTIVSYRSSSIYNVDKFYSTSRPNKMIADGVLSQFSESSMYSYFFIPEGSDEEYVVKDWHIGGKVGAEVRGESVGLKLISASDMQDAHESDSPHRIDSDMLLRVDLPQRDPSDIDLNNLKL